MSEERMPSNAPSEKELKPCPQCGNKDFAEYNGAIGCRLCGLIHGTDGLTFSIEKAKQQHDSWYCWKELNQARAEIERLKVAAEEEFQRAEGKAEMKRWFQEQFHAKDARIKELEIALERGTQCTCIGEGSTGYASCELHRILASKEEQK